MPPASAQVLGNDLLGHCLLPSKDVNGDDPMFPILSCDKSCQNFFKGMKAFYLRF